MADVGNSASGTSVPPSSRGSASSVAGTSLDGGDACGRQIGRKRPASGPAAEETADAILESARTGAQLTRPDQLTRDDVVFEWTPRDDLARKMRSAAWQFFELYRSQDPNGSLLGWCRLCAGLGTTNIQLMQKGTIGNSVKHFENTANGAGSQERRLVHSRAALLICRNATGGNRSKRVVDGTITRFFSPDARSHHLRFVMMQVMTYSPQVLTENPHVDAFVSGLCSYSTPSRNTMTHHLIEIYAWTLTVLRNRLQASKALYMGLPFSHAVTDLWSEKHSHMSYGSLVIRFVDPATTTMEVVHLGVAIFRGKHTHDKILSWVRTRLQYFGLDTDDLGSTTTDSGANVRKAMRSLEAPWLPCMAHSMHNAVKTAMGITRSENSDEVGEQPSRRPSQSRNPATKLLLSRTRRLLGHFNHSTLSVSIYKDLTIQGETEARSIIDDVPTRWSSTFRALARLYTSYSRLCAFFNAEGVSASARNQRL